MEQSKIIDTLETYHLVPGFLLRHLLLECHLLGFLSRRQRPPQTKIVHAPKPIQSWGVRRNLVRRRVGVLVAALRVSILGGRRLLVGAWAERRRHGRDLRERDREREGERGEDVDENAGGTT